jgi:type IX secretion system substrate protein
MEDDCAGLKYNLLYKATFNTTTPESKQNRSTMNQNSINIITCVILSFCGYSLCYAQSQGPEFLTCADSVLRLCVKDEGVRLPDNNQLYLGEGHPDATSCSVHVTQKKRVRATCGDTLQYEVRLFLNDSTPAILLTALTNIVVDSSNEAELIFDTAMSPDSAIHHAGIPYNLGCNDDYRIVWTVVDSCSQETNCTSNIQMYDCNKPEVDAKYLQIIPINITGFAHINPEELIEEIMDDCTGSHGFLFSMDPNKYQPDTLMYGCDIPNWGVVELLNIWIADKGIDLNCDLQIDWNERNIYIQTLLVVYTEQGSLDCGPVPIIIDGEILTHDILSIKDVTVTLSSPGQPNVTNVTGIDGKYSFYGVSINGEATVRPERNDLHRNGVSTLDLVKIQKHLLGIQAMDDPYQIIAADANNSHHISVIDLLEIRKLILGKYNEFPDNTSWRFVQEDYEFPEPQDPWFNEEAWPIEEIGSITFTDTTFPNNFDFFGIKIGDVNNTVQPNLDQIKPRASYSRVKFLANQQSYKTGDLINVPIRISSDRSLSGFQFTVTASEMEVINVLPGNINITGEHYALFGDKLTMSWFDENNIHVSINDVLFTIQLRATKPGSINQSLSINSDITEAELYLENEETFLPVLTFQTENIEDGLEIVSCAPNPWKEETIVNFYLPEEDKVTFTLFDVSGREVYTASKFLNEGSQQFQLKASDFSARGMMFFEINNSKERVFKKMIVME